MIKTLFFLLLQNEKKKRKKNSAKWKRKKKRREKIRSRRRDFWNFLKKIRILKSCCWILKRRFILTIFVKHLHYFDQNTIFENYFFRFCVYARILMSIVLEKYINIESSLIKKNFSRNQFRDFSIIDHCLLIDVDRRNSNAQNIINFFK